MGDIRMNCVHRIPDNSCLALFIKYMLVGMSSSFKGDEWQPLSRTYFGPRAFNALARAIRSSRVCGRPPLQLFSNREQRFSRNSYVPLASDTRVVINGSKSRCIA